jgi:cell wall-associated NlpC family hydrolase
MTRATFRKIPTTLFIMITSLVISTVVYANTNSFPGKKHAHLKVATAKSDHQNTATHKFRQEDAPTRIGKKTGLPDSCPKVERKPAQALVLKDSTTKPGAGPRLAQRIRLRYDDLFSENDNEQRLAELTDPDPNNSAGLSKSLEQKTDIIKMLRVTAYGLLGTRYRFGGSSKSGIDCSSFVQKVFRKLEVLLPRTAREQFEIGKEVSSGDLQKGDLIFFRTYAHFPSHVGIYLGNHLMIHASSHDRRVVISAMNTPYFLARFIGAKRMAKINPETFKFDELISGIEGTEG